MGQFATLQQRDYRDGVAKFLNSNCLETERDDVQNYSPSKIKTSDNAKSFKVQLRIHRESKIQKVRKCQILGPGMCDSVPPSRPRSPPLISIFTTL